MEPIEIQYRIAEPEFMAACNAHWSAHRQGTMSNIITGVVAIVLSSVLSFFIFWWALCLTSVGVILLLIILFRSLLWRRAFRDAKKYRGDISVVVKDESVHVESAEGKSDLNWDFFTWYLNTPEYVLLYMTKRSFSVIPKAAFPNGDGIQHFLDLVKSKLQRIR